MGGCATKPKTKGDEREAPLPVPAEEQPNVESQEKKGIEDQIEEKKVDDESQQHSLGSLLKEKEAKKEVENEKEKVEEIPAVTITKDEEKPKKEEMKEEPTKEVEAAATAEVAEVKKMAEEKH